MIYKTLRIFVRATSVLLLALSVMVGPSVAAHDEPGEGVIVEQTRHKRTDHKIVRIKCLVNRWWLMHTASNRFEVMNT